ncbi:MULTISPECIES: SDR family NAD(P)-dependent oxidoreductase [unclassified Rhizobium]|uniref:SDR family NAD(P)-dependent oxidoreductase n=1 Tax=unclassified Rhizobium TaxID=2613769 RepID=UPI0017835DE9|nr:MULTISPECIES: SDR family oxidoreductase [unclassified Rhizobium]MBD8688424.1 SDR family oxidoreductase [Rhizobium sp. CFBP 13644]MBD8693074.1 SDR family oxidoreductase [Rhizobium sp. CFBP 13717]
MAGVTLITGGASGIGRLHALRDAAKGATVAIIDLNDKGFAEVSARHSSIHAFRCDVTDHAALANIVGEIERDLGEIDRLFVCAAMMPGGELAATEPEKINRLMQINYGGTVNVTGIVLSRMLPRAKGDVVIYGSTAGIVPVNRFGAYGATKAAVNHYAKVLISENRNSGLRFQLVCPPAVDTPLIAQVIEDGPGFIKNGRTWISQMMAPEAVVASVEKALEAGREIHYPGRGKLIELAYRACPGILRWVSNNT